MKLNILALKKKINPILIKNDVKRAAIFGSYARGEAKKNSDIDILIEYKNDDKSLLDLVGLKLELEKKLRKKVDLGEYEMIKPRIKDRILKELVPIL